MQAGRLDRLVTIQARTTAQDSAGMPIETWADEEQVWAQKVPQRGDERFTARQIVGKAVTTWRLRFLDWLTVHNHRLLDGTQVYDIHDVREIGRRAGLELDATARSEG